MPQKNSLHSQYDTHTVSGPLVLKFGGAAVRNPRCLADVALLIKARYQENKDPLVVTVSAMGSTTNELIDLAYAVNSDPSQRELAMLVSTGERASCALLAMALHSQGLNAISFTGSQAGIVTNENHTDALILDVRPWRLKHYLDARCVVIVAGFQGVSRQGDVTTLGRGGTDTTAVALAAALGAKKVEFYKDVEGIYDLDPHRHPEAKLITALSYEQALDLLLSTRAKVLHTRSVKLAQKNNILLHVLPFTKPDLQQGTLVGSSKTVTNLAPCYEENDT